MYNKFIYTQVKDILRIEIKKNKKDYFFNQNIKFPNIIKNENDIFLFTEKNIKATFVGRKNIFGKIDFLNEKKLNLNLKNKIVLIKNADPGYDFIFSKKNTWFNNCIRWTILICSLGVMKLVYLQQLVLRQKF